MTRKQLKEYIKEMIISEVTMVGPKTDIGDAADIARTERTGIDVVKTAISQAKKTNMPVSVAEMSLNEFAKIAGDLETAIIKVIKDNPDLEVKSLRKTIRGSENVKNELDVDEEIFDNQLNKFIARVRGERELKKRGRKPLEKSDEPKKEAPKKEAPKKEAPKKSAPKKEDDEDEEVEDNWNKSSDDDGMEDEKSIDKKAQAVAKKGGSNLTKLNNITTQLKDLEKEMKGIADNYKKAEGSKNETLLSQLKEKTKAIKELEKLQDKLAADVV